MYDMKLRRLWKSAVIVALVGVVSLVAPAHAEGKTPALYQTVGTALLPSSSLSVDAKESPPLFSSSPTPSAVISVIEGKLLIKKAGSENWVEAAVGMTLELEDSIESGDDSRTVVTFFDGSTVELSNNTITEVTDLHITPENNSTTIKLKQDIGKTISRVNKLIDSASRYEIQTPAGVAGVRDGGTGDHGEGGSSGYHVC